MANGKKFEIGISGDAIEKLKELKRGFEEGDNTADDLNETIEELSRSIKNFGTDFSKVIGDLTTKVNNFRSTMEKIQTGVETSSTATKKFADNQQATTKAFADSMKSNDKIQASFAKQMGKLNEQMSVARQNAKAMAKEYQIAERVLSKTEDKMSARQVGLMEKQLKNLYNGKIDTGTFLKRARDISKVYSQELSIALDKNSQSAAALKSRQQDQKHEENMAKIAGQYAKKHEEAAAVKRKSLREDEKAVAVNAEKINQEKEITKQKEKQTKAQERQNEAKSRKMESQERKAEILESTAADRREDYLINKEMSEIARRQKLEKNELARQIIKDQMYAMTHGEYELDTNEAKKLALSTMRLQDTIRNIQNFAETGGYKGTVGASATSVLRSEQFYDNIYKQAIAWKRVNSEEGRAADTLGRMIEDAKSMQSGINRIHTAFGQLASTVSAIRGIGTELRKTMTAIAQPILNMAKQISSEAFKSSLEALKNMELSEIGFSNFYGQSAVPGIMQNVKQAALLSPMSAAQVASYVNQIAPLSRGNSQLALNATMGVAKMIQYSGGEVSTEMEYVIKNLRDVIAKGKALTIDIRQFNRAMPALTKVLAEMGESDMLKDGELSIDQKTAPKLLEAFQRINEYGDVATIFERTSETISGLLERLEEQMQLFIIDVGDFSGLTDLIKHTIHSFLEDENGLLSNLRMTAQFIGRDVVAWLKSRDWERVLEIAKEVAGTLWQGLKDSLGILRGALGGTDWKDTLKNLAETISSFIKGIANSYSWLLGIMNGLNKSGLLGSGLVQGAMGIFGFLSGNAGTLITGGLRGFGNFMGTLNQITFTLINSMSRAQVEYLKAATTVSTFEEALLLAVKSLSGFGEQILAIDSALGGILTAEQRQMVQTELETHQAELETTARQQHTLATKASQMAIEQEATTRGYNTAAMKAQGGSGGGLLGPALKGKGTRLGEIAGGAIKGIAVGSIVGALSSTIIDGIAQGFGADKYGAANAGNIVGSVGGWAAGGAMAGSAIAPGIGTLIGGIGGALVGAIKSGIESSGILDQSRKDELEAFKQTVNNGEYLKEVLNEINRGNDISVDEFDMINANLVSQMNQWAAATPSGTAQMLKDYLREIYINGRSIDDTVKEIGKTQDQQAETLWKFVEADDIEGGNDYAATLQETLSSYQIAAMIMNKALEHGKSGDETINYLLKWGKTNNAAGEDLTSEMIAGMSDRDREATAEKLKVAWTEIGMESVQNLQMDNDTKIELSKGLGEAMAKFLTGAMDEMKDSDWWYMNRFLSTAKVSNVSDIFGYSMSPSTMRAFLYDKNREKYGLDINNVGMWESDYKGHGAEDENGNPLGSSTYAFPEGMVESVTEGMSARDAWQWPEDHYKDYGLNTKEVIDEWRAEQNAKAAEEVAINKSQENTLWEIRDNTNRLVQQGGTAQEQFEAFKATLPQIQQQNKANGGIVYLAAGGSPRGVDTVPAMLQPGEFVVRRSAVEKVGLSAMNALNTGNLGYFARTIGRQDIYGDYNATRTWNYSRTSNDNRKSNRVIVNNFTRGARLNRYYSLANRMI